MILLSGCAGVAYHRTDTGLNVAFRMKDVKDVSMYASSDGYEEHKAQQIKDKWSVDVPYSDTLRYFITADGRQTLPDCTAKESDDFGGQVCVYEVEQ